MRHVFLSTFQQGSFFFFCIKHESTHQFNNIYSLIWWTQYNIGRIIILLYIFVWVFFCLSCEISVSVANYSDFQPDLDIGLTSFEVNVSQVLYWLFSLPLGAYIFSSETSGSKSRPRVWRAEPGRRFFALRSEMTGRILFIILKVSMVFNFNFHRPFKRTNCTF